MLPDDVYITLLALKQALEQVGIDYLVVGSLASSVHGLPRATRDADLIVAITPQQVEKLAATLRPTFYVSEEAALEAIRHGTSFNVIHEETFYQVDLFVMQPTPFHRMQFERGENIEIDPERNFTLPFQSAEDTILSKLDWFRQGHEVSERQWQDVLNILRAQGERLDHPYLRRWAVHLGVDDLLQRALDLSHRE
ncbi:MAG TPA: hypothetical protein ENJ31_05780 [Anaerolineae bacterium]|nr:hypothetical protein [Anaerolineae bacterium]